MSLDNPIGSSQDVKAFVHLAMIKYMVEIHRLECQAAELKTLGANSVT